MDDQKLLATDEKFRTNWESNPQKKGGNFFSNNRQMQGRLFPNNSYTRTGQNVESLILQGLGAY